MQRAASCGPRHRRKEAALLFLSHTLCSMIPGVTFSLFPFQFCDNDYSSPASSTLRLWLGSCYRRRPLFEQEECVSRRRRRSLSGGCNDMAAAAATGSGPGQRRRRQLARRQLASRQAGRQASSEGNKRELDETQLFCLQVFAKNRDWNDDDDRRRERERIRRGSNGT